MVIDIGNTRVKTGVFDHDKLVVAQAFDTVESASLQELANAHGVTHVLVASSGDQIEDGVVETQGMVIHLTPETPVPVQNLYKTPETLGQDRLAGVVGAAWLYPGANVLVVDAGTCVTYDLLEESGSYLGGNIAPGLDMRLMAMHYFTKRLPSVHRSDTPTLLGESTEEALQNGGILGLLMEIAGYIELLGAKYPSLNTVLTGGDAPYLAEQLNARFSIQPHLILIGLNQILEFNVAKHN